MFCFRTYVPLCRHDSWAPLLRQHSDTFPLACRCVEAACCLTFQNCDVERDLAILRKLQVKTNQHLHDESIDQRARVRLCVDQRPTKFGVKESKDLCGKWHFAGQLRLLAREFQTQQGKVARNGKFQAEPGRGKLGSTVPLLRWKIWGSREQSREEKDLRPEELCSWLSKG